MGDSIAVLLTGAARSGKSTVCQRVIDLAHARGLNVAGVLTLGGDPKLRDPQVVIDLHGGESHRLAMPLGDQASPLKLGQQPDIVGFPPMKWAFDRGGLDLGRRAFERALGAGCDILVVDQVGPLEVVAGDGWTVAFDAMINGRYRLAIMVVNSLVVDQVAERLRGVNCVVVQVREAIRDALPAFVFHQLGRLGPSDSVELPVIMEPRLVACDLDGTLLDSDGSPTSGAVKAISTLRESGLHIVPCTGRSIGRTLEAARSLGLLDGFAVCVHGAAIIDLSNGRCIEQLPLPPGVASAAVRIAHPLATATAYVGDEVWEMTPAKRTGVRELTGALAGGAARPLSRAARPVPGAKTFPSFLEDASVTRLILEPVEGADLGALAATLAGKWPDVRVGPAPGGRLALHHAAASKLRALRTVCERLGVDRAAVVACGDDGDDAEMLLWAGFGIAVMEAAGDVRYAADAVVPRAKLGALLAKIAPLPRDAS